MLIAVFKIKLITNLTLPFTLTPLSTLSLLSYTIQSLTHPLPNSPFPLHLHPPTSYLSHTYAYFPFLPPTPQFPFLTTSPLLLLLPCSTSPSINPLLLPFPSHTSLSYTLATIPSFPFPPNFSSFLLPSLLLLGAKVRQTDGSIRFTLQVLCINKGPGAIHRPMRCGAV